MPVTTRSIQSRIQSRKDRLEKYKFDPVRYKNEQAQERKNSGFQMFKTISTISFELLTELYMSGSKLKQFPVKVIMQCPLLEIIDLQGNQITLIPTGVLDCFTKDSNPRLEILLLAHNKIDTIEKGAFKKCEKLSHVDLSYNKLEQDDQEFVNCKRLRFLSFKRDDIP